MLLGRPRHLRHMCELNVAAEHILLEKVIGSLDTSQPVGKTLRQGRTGTKSRADVDWPGSRLRVEVQPDTDTLGSMSKQG